MLKDNTYITITRQYGSGGKEVANIVAKKLGINCYDRKIVHLAAERFHNSTEPISNEVMEDLITTSYSMPGSLGDYSFESIPFYNKMFKEQSIAILKLAQKGSAVFLGRCSDYILKDYPNTFSFFSGFQNLYFFYHSFLCFHWISIQNNKVCPFSFFNTSLFFFFKVCVCTIYRHRLKCLIYSTALRFA